VGKFKSIFVACLGIGIAAGAGYYLNWKYIRKDGEKDKGSSTQVKTDRPYSQKKCIGIQITGTGKIFLVITGWWRE